MQTLQTPLPSKKSNQMHFHLLPQVRTLIPSHLHHLYCSRLRMDGLLLEIWESGVKIICGYNDPINFEKRI